MVLLDVSAVNEYLKVKKNLKASQNILVLLGAWSLFRSGTSVSCSSDFGMEMVVGPVCSSIVRVCSYNSGKSFETVLGLE